MSEVAGATVSAADVAKQWLDVLARGAVEEWSGVTDEALLMHVVFMPGGAGPVQGRSANAAIVGEFWKAWKTFAFHDVEAHESREEPGLVFMTARSEAETAWGASYANTYVFRTRIANGKVVEHREYFDPLPVLETFKDHLPG